MLTNQRLERLYVNQSEIRKTYLDPSDITIVLISQIGREYLPGSTQLFFVLLETFSLLTLDLHQFVSCLGQPRVQRFLLLVDPLLGPWSSQVI